MSGVVILGSGLAGYNLVKEFRRFDSRTPLLMITADSGNYYSKPMLSAGISQKRSINSLVLKSAAEMEAEYNMRVVTNREVADILPAEKKVITDDGQSHAYAQLVLALGADPVRSELGGNAADSVLVVNNLEGYERYRSALPEGGRVIILGAGMVGCEFANDLCLSGYDPQIIGLSGHIMPEILPPDVGNAVRFAMEESGVGFYMNRFVVAVDHNEGGGLQVTLNDGSVLNGDVVLQATGLSPRTGLARRAGLAVAQGIQVDNFLQTSASSIYALGDCAEVRGLNLQYVLPLMACTRALARTLAGDRSAVTYGPMPVSVKTSVCPVVASPPEAGRPGRWHIEQSGRNVRALFLDGAELYGYALCGAATADKMQLNRRLPVLLG